MMISNDWYFRDETKIRSFGLVSSFGVCHQRQLVPYDGLAYYRFVMFGWPWGSLAGSQR